MKNYFYLILFLLIFFGFFVFAQGLENITYPVAELGNCANKADCAVYCDVPENAKSCIDFSEAHGLISNDDAAMSRKMLEMGDAGGPGDCQGRVECEAYCDIPDHMEECIEFAKKYSLIPPDELADVEKVLAAVKQGYKPPACHGKAACDAYCNLAEHFEECITFGEAAGLIPPDEIDDARKTLEAVKKGAKPPACRGKAECDAYCAEEQHFEECLNFAEAAGFMSAEDAAMARKTGGKGPGGCHGEEACKSFCEDPANMEECINFAVQIGEMTLEQAEQAKKGMEMMQRGGPPPGAPTGPPLEGMPQGSLPEGGMPPEGMMPGGPSSEGMMGPFEGMMGPPQEGMMPSEGMMPFGPPEGMMGPPSPEEIQRMQQEGMQKAMEQFQQMIPQGIMSPEGMMGQPSDGGGFPGPGEGGGQVPAAPPAPPSDGGGGGGEAPQSLFDQAKLFLANLLSALSF